MPDQQLAGDATARRPSATAAPSLGPHTEQLKPTHALQDDDTSLSPDAKRRRTGTSNDAVSFDGIPGSGPALTKDLNVADTSPSAASQDAGRIPTQEELGGIPTPPARSSSTEQAIETRFGLLDQARPVEGVSKQQTGAVDRPFTKPNSSLKSQSLPILDNLATQILGFVARTSFQDLSTLLLEPQSENAQSYSTLRSLFDHTKKVYTTSQSFLSASDLGFTDPNQVEVIRKANLALFVFNLFGSQEIGFPDMHSHFLDIFVPEGGRLLKSQAALFLELKTQTFIASMNNPTRPKAEILYELFPDNLGVKLLARKPGSRHPAPSETDFIKRAWSRRDILLGEINNPDSVNTLSEKYLWQDFLRDVSIYVSKNIDAITTPLAKRTNKNSSPTSPQEEVVELPASDLETQFPVAPPHPPEPAPIERRIGKVDLVARAARAAQIALQGQGVRRATATSTPPVQHLQPQQSQQPNQHQHQPQQDQSNTNNSQNQQRHHQPSAQPSQNPPQSQIQPLVAQASTPTPPPPPLQPVAASQSTPQTQPATQTIFTNYAPPPTSSAPQLTAVPFQNQFHFQQYSPQLSPEPSGVRTNSASSNYGYMPGVPHYSQSEPTQILYERARLATTTRSSPSSRRAGLPSQRRPWTTEEENALMAGLDRVKGPHWSQILSMFGPGGTISEALKDRNQVQLKDKARNLKLFFLKSGIEVPYYLKFVTGELKTRAPAQAAKQEARERERQQGEEDKAHVEGIEGMMALAGAHASASMEPSIGSIDSHANTQPGTPVGHPQQQDIHHHLHHHEQDQQAAERSAEQALYQSLAQDQKVDLDHQRNYVDPSL